MTKILKILSVVLIIIAVGWSIPKFLIKDQSKILNEHIVVQAMEQTLNRPVDKFLLLQTKVSSGVLQFGTPSVIYVNAYTWFGVKYATVKLDCLQGMFFSSCTGEVI